MPPGDLNRLLQDYAARIEKNTKRIDRLETLEFSMIGAGGWVLIEELFPTGATVTFSNIPATFRHLHLRWLAQSDGTFAAPTIALNFNGDFGLSYFYTAHLGLFSWGTDPDLHVVTNGGSGPDDNIALGQIPGTIDQETESFGWGFADINYYTLPVYKGVLIHSGCWRPEDMENAQTYLASGQWEDSAAINEIVISMAAGQDFVSPSAFSLYGIS